MASGAPCLRGRAPGHCCVLCNKSSNRLTEGSSRRSVASEEPGGTVMVDTRAGRGPAGMGIAAGDVPWDPRYLQLEPPAEVHTFDEFGHVDHEVLLSPVAVTEPF